MIKILLFLLTIYTSYTLLVHSPLQAQTKTKTTTNTKSQQKIPQASETNAKNVNRFATEEEKNKYLETKAMLIKVLKLTKIYRNKEAMEELKTIFYEKKDILKKYRKINNYWHRFMGRVLEQEKQHKKSINFYKRALKVNPKDIYSAFKISYLSLFLGIEGDAKEYVEYALEISPNNKKVLALKQKIKEKFTEYSDVSEQKTKNIALNDHAKNIDNNQNSIGWEAGLGGAIGHGLTENFPLSFSGNAFLRYSYNLLFRQGSNSVPNSFYIGFIFDFYYNQNTSNINSAPSKIDYKTILSFYSACFELSYSFHINNAWLINTGIGFGYYYGKLKTSYATENSGIITPAANSKDIQNPMLSVRTSFSFLFISNLSLNIDVRYLGYLDGSNGFDKAIHFFSGGLSISYFN